MAQVPPTAPPEARPVQAVHAVEERHAMPAGLARWAAPAWPLRRAAVLLALSIVYFATAKLGLLLAWVHASATAVWPPTGIALAALLLLGDSAWPAIAAGAFLANITTHGTLAACAGIATGNTLEALAGAWLVRRFAHGREAFYAGLDAFLFTALGGVVATTISATLGVLSVTLTGDSSWARFGSIWFTWWLGDMGGAFVVAPLILLWSGGPPAGWTRARVVEAVCAFGVLLVAGQSIFGWLAPVGREPVVLKFLCIPVLTWIAYRFDPRTAATGVFVLAAIAVTGTVRTALASQPGELNESLMLLQVYLAVSAMSTLVLAAAVHERSRAERALRAASAELREALAEVEAFNHAISHEVRQPLTTIYNYASTLLEDQARSGGDSVWQLKRIQAAVMSSGKLLDDLVKFVWGGDAMFPRRWLDMTQLARETCAEVVVDTEDGGAVRFEVGELPPAHVNPQMLARVLHNLLTNAVKFTRGREARRVVISGHVEDEENVYSVADNGIGFEPALADMMFLPLRPRKKDEPKREGSGLGLAIVAKIVRRYGGRVGAESDGTSGSRFWFTLPHGGDR